MEYSNKKRPIVMTNIEPNIHFDMSVDLDGQEPLCCTFVTALRPICTKDKTIVTCVACKQGLKSQAYDTKQDVEELSAVEFNIEHWVTDNGAWRDYHSYVKAMSFAEKYANYKTVSIMDSFMNDIDMTLKAINNNIGAEVGDEKIYIPHVKECVENIKKRLLKK